MTLLEATGTLGSLDDEGTIYAEKPWTAVSLAFVAREPDDGGVPSEAKAFGLAYFLEVRVARELLEDWKRNQQSAPTDIQACQILIKYAANDA